MECFKRFFWCFALDKNQETRPVCHERLSTPYPATLSLRSSCDCGWSSVALFVVRGFNVPPPEDVQVHSLLEQDAIVLFLTAQPHADNWTLRSKKESIFREWKIFWRCSTYVTFWVTLQLWWPTLCVGNTFGFPPFFISEPHQARDSAPWHVDETQMFSVSAVYVQNSHAKHVPLKTLCGHLSTTTIPNISHPCMCAAWGEGVISDQAHRADY